MQETKLYNIRGYMIIMHCVNNDNDFVLYYPIE
ncbi:hypothetical protein CNEO3_1720002 [Clostridium neonatale]|nr:hypothetical protein CNEO4_1580002 [Clostridium neonatale]CAI3564123.1 hypothetical protein CNEO3_1390002 [Clostridium neonatale]CAI3596035.1 hypothetical protein CNEO3_1720002 [Clostridium neonatale]CAI3599991.1 hypothetical protein CNEO4_1780003 [Clostridium neonatale]